MTPEHSNKMHFIWFGRDLTKIDGNIDNLIRIAKKNPLYLVYLWTDQASYDSTSELMKKLGILNVSVLNFDKHQFTQNIEGVDSLINFFREPTKEKLKPLYDQFWQKSFVFYDGNGKANFAAASDLARALILLNYGGIYTDFDTNLLKPLPDINEILQKTDVVLSFDGTYEDFQKSFDSNDLNVRYKYRTVNICNDIVCCHPKNESIKYYLVTYLSQLKKYPKSFINIVGYDQLRQDSTEKLGPALMRYSAVKHKLETINMISYDFLGEKAQEFTDYSAFCKLYNEKHEKRISIEREIIESIVVPILTYYTRGNANSWFANKSDGIDLKFEKHESIPYEGFRKMIKEAITDLFTNQQNLESIRLENIRKTLENSGKYLPNTPTINGAINFTKEQYLRIAPLNDHINDEDDQYAYSSTSPLLK